MSDFTRNIGSSFRSIVWSVGERAARRQRARRGKPLRVVHAPYNTASLMSHNARAQEKLGIDVDAVCTTFYGASPIQSHDDVKYVEWMYPKHDFPWTGPMRRAVLPRQRWNVLAWLKVIFDQTHFFLRWFTRQIIRLPGMVRAFITRTLMLYHTAKVFGETDIVHWYSGMGVDRWVFDYFRANKTVGLTAWQGCEVRLPDREYQDNPYYRLIGLAPNGVPWETTGASHIMQEFFNEFGWYPLVTVGMAQYVLPQYRDKMYQIFHPVPLPDVPRYPDPHKKHPIVVHAPSAPTIKGTQYVRDAVEFLKGKVDFEYIELFGMQRDEAIEVIANCDVFIDQVLLGDHGMATLEAMSFGKPVLVYIKPSLVEGFPDDLPIINTNPDNIISRLYWMLTDGQARHDFGMASRAYIEKYHDPEKTAARLVEIYQEVLERDGATTGAHTVEPECVRKDT